MYSILDIDLDYFNQMPEPASHLERLLDWAASPVSVVVEHHHQAFARWRMRCRTHDTAPSHILHVDEHHDMMDQREQINMANFMFHAMRMWPRCQVHWLVRHPIDSPAMWIEDETWEAVRQRFSCGARPPAGWPQPDLVSVCTSPGFVSPKLTAVLLEVVSRFASTRQKARCRAKDRRSRGRSRA